jgi:alpha-tubulin suppressor-like RCC1 family protein
MSKRPIFWILFLLCCLLNSGGSMASPRVTGFSAGENFTVFILDDGSLWGLGYNGWGQMGAPDGTVLLHPRMILSSGVQKVAAGGRHLLILKSDSTLWSLGSNDQGQGGSGAFPAQIISEPVTDIAAGSYSSLVIKSNGSLWACGQGIDPTNSPRFGFEQIVASGVVSMADGGGHHLFIKSDSSLWGWGSNGLGQLGDGTGTNHPTPFMIVPGGVATVGAGWDSSAFVKTDGTAWVMGYGILGDGSNTNRLRPVQIMSEASSVLSGLNFAVFLKADGTLWNSGLETSRLDPNLVAPGNVTVVSAGLFHCLFTKSDGTLWGFGQYGAALGIERQDQVFPIRIFPPPLSSRIEGLSVNPSNVVIQAGNIMAGGTYSILTSTNLTASLAQWTSIATNMAYSDGAFTISSTNTPTAGTPPRFYMLGLP